MQEVAAFSNGPYNFPNLPGPWMVAQKPLHLFQPQNYYNRKGCHITVLQAVVREDMPFTYVSVGMPGSTHDAGVLHLSSLWETGRNKCQNGIYHQIADAAYPSKIRC